MILKQTMTAIENNRGELANRLRAVMSTQPLTARQYARDIGIDRLTMSRFFKGKPTSLMTYLKIEKYVTTREAA